MHPHKGRSALLLFCLLCFDFARTVHHSEEKTTASLTPKFLRYFVCFVCNNLIFLLTKSGNATEIKRGCTKSTTSAVSSAGNQWKEKTINHNHNTPFPLFFVLKKRAKKKMMQSATSARLVKTSTRSLCFIPSPKAATRPVCTLGTAGFASECCRRTENFFSGDQGSCGDANINTGVFLFVQLLQQQQQQATTNKQATS